MAFPTVGSLAPTFSLSNQSGERISLTDFKGEKNVVVYFYPKASTPGCTVQACGIRDTLADFAALDTVVLGISPDPVTKLQKFVNKYDLNFNLLADEDHSISEQYGVWGLKKFMGREFMGVLRTTFLINRERRIIYIMDRVNTKSHDQELLKIIRQGI